MAPTKKLTANANAKDWQTQRADFDQGRLVLRVLFLGLLVALMVGLLVYILPYSPDRTPMFVLAEAGYGTPWPANGWANEDVGHLQSLDGALIDVHKIETSSGDTKSFLDDLRLRVGEEASAIENVGCALVYVNCICTVNRNSEPCFVLKGQEPSQPENWLRLVQVLDVLGGLSQETQKVIFIDGVRYIQDWDLAEPLSPFADCVQDLVSSTSVENVSIITSSAAGQFSPSRNAFTASLTKAIAGARPDDEQNVDGPVTFDVLVDRLEKWISDATRKTEERRQDIALFTNAPSKRWTVSVGLSSAKWSELAPGITNSANSNLSNAELESLWQRYSSLSKDLLLSSDPERLFTVERNLFRLEELAQCGPSLKQQAMAEQARLEDELDDLRALDADLRRSYISALGPNKDYFLSKLMPHSLSLATSLGMLAEADSAAVSENAAGFAFDVIPERIELSTGKQIPRFEFEEVHLPRILQSEKVGELWGDSETLRPALELIHTTSRYSAPESGGPAGSLRSYSMLLPELEQIQNTGRLLIDQLFIGPSRSGTQDELINLLQTQQAEYQERYQELCSAWSTSDKANYQRWYYLKWLAHPSREQDSSRCDFDLKSARDLCQQLLDESLQLNNLLDSPHQDSLPLADISKSREDLELTLANLESMLDTFAADLVDNSNVGGYVLREVQAIQALPFLKAQQRSALRSKETELLAEIAGLEVAKNDEELPKSPRERVLELASSSLWGIEAARGILPLDKGGVNDETPASKIKAFREELYTQQLMLGDSLEPSLSDNPSTLSKYWQQANLMRSRGCVWHPSLAADPYSKLQLVMVRNMLHALAQKSVLDCFGSSPSGTIAQKPFYEIVVRDYSEASNNLAVVDVNSPIDFSDLLEQVSEQKRYLEGGVRFTAVDKSVIPGISPLYIDAEVQDRRRGGMAAVGEAAVFLAAPDGEKHQLLSSIRADSGPASSSIGLPLRAPLSLHYELRSAGLMPSGQYELLTLFRGNRIRTPLAVLGSTGYRYEWTTLNQRDSTVTVYGDNLAVPSVLFILDCSESMASPVRGESGGTSNESKLEIAAGSLLRMLRELAESGRQTRVGVILLGHRMGWSADAPLQLLTQPKLSDTTPETLTPSQDVELVLPLGRFDTQSYAKLVEYMNSVDAWGQSPIYLAVQNALEEIQGKAPPTAAAIVMITDGLNYQFTPASRAQASASPIGEEQIVQAIEDSGVPIHILGFSIAESDLAAAEETYQKLSSASNGSFNRVNDEQKLIESLRKQLGTSSYEVKNPDSALPDEESKGNLNQPIKVRLASSSAESRIVSFEDARAEVVVEGGEALQMRYVPTLGRFEPIPFDVEFPVSAELTPPPTARLSDLIARVHRPLVGEEKVTFSVSLQSLAMPFTPRPKECFIQVEPLSKEGLALGAPIFYFDNNWVSDKSVPMLRWEVDGWPADATKARVHIGCKFAKTPAAESVGVEKFYRPGALEGPKEFAGIPGVRFTFNMQEDPAQGLLTLTVTEIHDEPGKQGQVIKVATSGRIPTKATSRYFDSEHGVASHIFHFNLADKAGVLQGTNLELTPMASLEEDAYFTETSIETDLVLGEELLPFDAAEGPFEEQLPAPESELQLEPSGS